MFKLDVSASTDARVAMVVPETKSSTRVVVESAIADGALSFTSTTVIVKEEVKVFSPSLT